MNKVSPWLLPLLLAMFPGFALTKPQVGDPLTRAEELVRQGKFNEAEKAFLAILHRDPKSYVVHNDLGALYLQQKRYDSACRELSIAASLNPQEVAIQQNLGMCWFQSNHFVKAGEALEIAERLDPEDLKTRYLRGYSMLMLGRLQEAEKDLEYVRTQQPQDENTLFSLVRIYRAEKKDQQAIDTFQDLVGLIPIPFSCIS